MHMCIHVTLYVRARAHYIHLHVEDVNKTFNKRKARAFAQV